MSIGDLKTYLRVKAFNLKEFFRSLKYYRNLRFCLSDLSLLLIYFFFNPYKISKNFLIKQNSAQIHSYGETPFTTLEKIAKNCALSPNDKCFELGAGRGRSSFWLSHFIKCNMVAVEWIPFFSISSKIISKIFRTKNIFFANEDMLSSSFEGATFIYLYGTMLEDRQIMLLIEKFKKIKNLKVITISYPLENYDRSFTTLHSFDVKFPWGETSCYLNQLR